MEIHGPHIILVDPSDTREVLTERLRMQGYSVTVTNDPGEGAHLALSEPPAAMVADLWMPSISGVQLCRLLRSESATQHVPVILRGPEQSQRNRFWAERAGAHAYVGLGRMGDLVRAIERAIQQAPLPDGFFTQLSGGHIQIRDRIAVHLDNALFDSVVASEVRALSVCETFTRQFDLLSQFVARVSTYRWLAVYQEREATLYLHTHPDRRAQSEAEARRALSLQPDAALTAVEDEDAMSDEGGPAPFVEPISLGRETLGRIALAPRAPGDPRDGELIRIVARELGGPIRIAALVEASQRLAMVDPLTGLMNRRAFSAALDIEVSRSRRHGYPMCVLLLDIDLFKQINDRCGHQSGDLVLAAVGRVLTGEVRKGDLAGRWGGEEFVLAVTSTDVEGAIVFGERVRAHLERLQLQSSEGVAITVTGSLGIAAFRPTDDLDTLVDRADRAMYVAKATGRNRVCVSQDREVADDGSNKEGAPNLKMALAAKIAG